MLSFHLDTGSQIPLYEQIYNHVKSYILNGDLRTGEKLPSTRGLATSLGVSRNTVDTAYYQLLAEGFIDTAPKSGFYVCELDLSETSLYPKHISGTGSFTLPQAVPVPGEENSLSSHIQPIRYDFSPFAVDLSHFPYSVWKKLSKKALDESTDLFLLGESDGDSELRQAVCNYVRLSREVHCTPAQIIIGAGADYLLQMLALTMHHLKIQHITMENPCYRKAAEIFKSNDFTLHTGILDQKGLTIPSIHPESQLVYVTPSHQYPLGLVMPFGRRQELLDWAYEQKEHYIIEDDHDSEFRYKGKPIPALQGMDSQGKVIYMGTFSKAVAPAIRVSYMILPPALLTAYHQFCGHYSCTVSRLDQAILTCFLREGYFEKHVNRMRKIYRGKHDLVLELLKPLIQSEKIHIHGENAGLHLVLTLSDGLKEEEIIAHAAQSGIRLYGMKEHYLHLTDSAPEAILLGYSNLTEEEIKEGLNILLLEIPF